MYAGEDRREKGDRDMFSALNSRSVGRLALISGLIGLIGFGFLVMALSTPPPSPGTLRRATDPFRWQDASIIIQSLLMLPVSFGFISILRGKPATFSEPQVLFGLIAFGTLCISSALIFSGTVSDMFYMLPQGLVGLWVVWVSGRLSVQLGHGVLWLGRISGFGLILIGLGFVIYGVFVAPRIFAGLLSNQEMDSKTWTTANILAHMLMAAGTILGRALNPFWLLLLGRRLSTL